MENKNILLVIASVSLFLVIVIGGGLWLFWPKADAGDDAESAAVQPLFDQDFDSFEFYKSREELPGLLPEEEAGRDVPGRPDGEQADEITLAIGQTEDSEEKVTIEEKGAEREPTPEALSGSKTASETRPAERARQKSQPAVAARTVQKKPSRRIAVKEYEIQVGSYKTKDRAESVTGRLKELGLAGNIRTKDIGGQTYYRVRIGPYSNQGEAAKFLAWIRDVKGMEDSYISQVTRVKVIN